ncbi:MAG: hypothetical protein AAGL69_00880 [Pseudomonadota bacterium]
MPTGSALPLTGDESTPWLYVGPALTPADLAVMAGLNAIGYVWDKFRMNKAQSRLALAGLTLPMPDPEMALANNYQTYSPVDIKLYVPQADELEPIETTAATLAARHNTDSVVYLYVQPSIAGDLDRHRLDVRQLSFNHCDVITETCDKAIERWFHFLSERTELDDVEVEPLDVESERSRLEAAEAQALTQFPEQSEEITARYDRFRKRLDNESFMRDVQALRTLWSTSRLDADYQIAFDELSAAIAMDWARTEINRSQSVFDRMLRFTVAEGYTVEKRVHRIRYKDGRSMYLTRDGDVVVAPGLAAWIPREGRETEADD